MTINTSTVYTRERLINFNDYMASKHKLLSILVVICTIITFAAFALSCAVGNVTGKMIVMVCAMIVLDLIVVLMYWVLPRFMVKKVKNLNYTINYSFDEEDFTLNTQSNEVCENITLKYSFLKSIERGKNGDIYLFIEFNQAYIVDTTVLSYEEISQLKNIFGAKTDKFKWVD